MPKSLAALAGILVLAVFISPAAGDGSRIFLQAGNLTDILRQVSLIGILSLSMTFVILTGGIDLSVGSILALSTAVTAMWLTRAYPGGIAGAIVAAAVVCAVAGAVNGIVIAGTGMQPFIVTLASMIGVRALGDNEKAARFAGLPVRRTKVWVYTLSGLLSGCAGVLYAAENHQGNPNAGVAYELDAIAAVVIGGTRLAGGRGSISGTIVGTLIMGVLTNMLRLNNVDSNVEMMIKAVIIVLAVAVQRGRAE